MSVLLIDEIPNLVISYHEIKNFISKYDQVSYFKELWGDSYYKNIEIVWEKQLLLYKSGQKPDCQWREAILVIIFDYYLGPYVGLPEKIKIQFYQWLLDDIRSKIV